MEIETTNHRSPLQPYSETELSHDLERQRAILAAGSPGSRPSLMPLDWMNLKLPRRTNECDWCGDSGYPPDAQPLDFALTGTGFWSHYCLCARGKVAGQEASERLATEWAERLRFAGVPLRERDHTLSTFVLAGGRPKVAAQIAAWIDGAPGNLYLWGPNGVGKTGLACIALMGQMWRTWRLGRFIEMARLRLQLRDGFRDDSTESVTEIINDLTSIRHLVIDDFRLTEGVRGPTEFILECVRLIIDGRYQRTLATIITSNLSPDLFMGQTPRAVAERVLERATIVGVKGRNLRFVAHEIGDGTP